MEAERMQNINRFWYYLFLSILISLILINLPSKIIRYTIHTTEDEQKELSTTCNDCFILTSETGCREINIMTNWKEYPAFYSQDKGIITFANLCNSESVDCNVFIDWRQKGCQI